MVIDNQKELEALLNEAAERYDAPDMAQIAEYLVDNGVVAAPCKIGDKIYSLVHLDDEDRTIIDTLTVTEVGQRYIFCSAYNLPRDDITDEISLDRIGKDVFLSRLDAEMAKKGAISSEVVEKSSTLHTASALAKSVQTSHPRGSGLSEEKQIEEMANDLRKSEHWYFDDTDCDFELDRKKTAENLYTAGYRKRSEGIANNATATSEWISVDERLPDEQGHFLIVDKEGQMNTAFYTPRFGWFSHFRIKNITHWMPLPEAPKGGAG